MPTLFTMEPDMNIEITGLNQRQRSIADVIWACQSKDQVMSFIRSLQGDMKRDAESVLELMMWAVWDQIDSIDEETHAVIQRARRA